MTFKEMYTELLEYFPKADLNAEKGKEFLNRAYRQLAMSFQFLEVEQEQDVTTTADTATITKPTGARDIVSIYNETEKEKLIPESIQFYDNQDTSTDTTSAPTNYILYGTSLYVWPTPDDVYTLRIRYRALPTEMSTNTEEPVYPDEWHEAIILLAASKAGFYLGLDSKAINLKNEGLGLISTLQEDQTMASRRRIGQISVQRTRRGADDTSTKHAEWL